MLGHAHQSRTDNAGPHIVRKVIIPPFYEMYVTCLAYQYKLDPQSHVV